MAILHNFWGTQNGFCHMCGKVFQWHVHLPWLDKKVCSSECYDECSLRETKSIIGEDIDDSGREADEEVQGL